MASNKACLGLKDQGWFKGKVHVSSPMRCPLIQMVAENKKCLAPSLSDGIHLCISAQIVADNIQYAKAVKFTGTRENAAALDFSGILEEVRTHVWGRACVGAETPVCA